MHEATRYPKPFGKYLLIRQLAVGGMAEVYLARQSGPAGFEKECVIKRILPALAVDQQFVQMFLDEARIAARLSHPNIVQIYEFGTVADHDYFLAMEHVHGVDVQQVFDAESGRHGKIPLPIALRLVSQVAEGLDHAHRATDGRGQQLGLVHRDVTPSNVIVSFDGVAKVLDFGIAKAVAKQGRTEVGVIKGKIPYMSPEQVQGETLDGRSDLFSLGTVLYELTTGQKPFEGTNAAELSLKIAHDEPTPPEVLADNYPERLSRIVLRSLNKRKQGRYQSGREMQEALEEFLIASAIRCTSHDVAAYLEDLFPGRRAELAQQVDLPVQVNDPTIPMALPGTGSLNLGGAAPVMGGDLSSSQLGNYDDVRRNLRGGGVGGKLMILLLVGGVAFGFWWLRDHMGLGDKALVAPAAKPDVAAAAVAKPAEPKPPEANAVPSPAAPTTAMPQALSPTAPAPAPAPATATATGTAPATATPPATPTKTAPATAAPSATDPEAKPDKPVKPPRAHHHDEEAPRALPHLPTPPPAEEE